jgi:L-rhamnonate dehydratase
MSTRWNRRTFLAALGAAGAASSLPRNAVSAIAQDRPSGIAPLRIESVEVLELHGHYTATAGVNKQAQVNPEDVYDTLRPPEYHDHPGGPTTVKTEAMYIRIRATGGLEGLYGPIEREPAMIVQARLKPFLIGKDALAGEVLWDQLYRSDRHSRDGYYMMAISAVDNTLWDLRGKFYGLPVYRLLGGPSREKVEMYVSTLGSSLELNKVRTRALELQKQGFRYQKWFIAYGPGSGPEGMRKNVELVKTLRETLGDDTELMFDTYSGWDQDYALEWAHQVEKYRPHWMEEVTHPEKIGSFAEIHRSTTVPVASGEHFYGRWEVQRYLQQNALSVVQADPEWCGGVTELIKIGTVCSLYDIPVIPHGHSLRAAVHTIFSQSPMTFPLGEYLAIKMEHYYHFEKNPMVVQNAHIALPTGAGFDVQLDPAKIDTQKAWTGEA